MATPFSNYLTKFSKLLTGQKEVKSELNCLSTESYLKKLSDLEIELELLKASKTRCDDL